MNATLAHVPTPEPGETLSSLLLRLGRNHAATPHELCSLLWPRFQVWTRDIDRTASDSFLAEIARVTGWSRDLLERATLRGLVKATGFAERTSGCQDGILALGVFHRVRRRFGQQFCPVCLAGLPRYLRLMWRFEFMVTCPEHGVLLRDACPHCDAPFIPHRNQSLILARCYRCGRSLLGGRRKTAPQLAARLQHGIVAAMAAARPDVADSLGTIGIDVSKATILGQIEPAAWLDGVRRLCRLATNEAHRPGTRNGGSAWARIRVAILVRQLRIEAVGTRFTFETRQVVQLPLTCLAYPFAGRDVTGDDGLRISACGFGVMTQRGNGFIRWRRCAGGFKDQRRACIKNSSSAQIA